ncbi:MAG: sigma-70 family RNA polymerase sigma factor [Lachnospiraceae bacterium]|nr:sigma-70 family RNA polymerase sigma factor [Lachnospiraceae bacterium]
MAIDKELAAAVKQVLAGEEQGFNYIYNETYSYVFSRCRMIMKNDDDASELLQETYIAAYKSLDKLSDVNSIFSWLGSIAYNQGMKMFRKRKDVLLDEDGEGLFEVQENADVSTIPGHEMEIKEIAGIIKDIIDDLPEAQRAVVMAYYYDEMSVNDIAAAMEVSAGTVKSRLNYARKHIEEAVNAKEKQLGIKLHTLVAPVLCTALGLRLSAVAISENTARKLYVGICAKSGIAALSALEATGSGALSSVAVGASSSGATASAGGSVSAATGSAISGAAASAGSNAAAGAIAEGVSGVTSVAAGKAAGATLVSTLVKAAAAIVLVGAGTAGVIYYTTHKDNRSDSTDKIEATTEVMNDISDSTKDNVTDADDKASVSSDDNNSGDNVTDKTLGNDNETGSNGTDNATGNTSGNAADGTTENASTEDESVENPNIEAVEQEGATTQATTQAATQQKTENKSTRKQEVEFDDMEF